MRRGAAVRTAAEALRRPVAVMQDLQGPKLRVGRLADGGPVRLIYGSDVPHYDARGGGYRRPGVLQLRRPSSRLRVSDRILLDDGLLRLTVTAIEGDTVVTRVDKGGPLGEHKGINLPGGPSPPRH